MKTIKYCSDGRTIIMSRGLGGMVLNVAQESALLPKPEFTLSFDGVPLTPVTSKSVDRLSNGRHVVQSFSFGVMSRVSHTLIGLQTRSKRGVHERTESIWPLSDTAWNQVEEYGHMPSDQVGIGVFSVAPG